MGICWCGDKNLEAFSKEYSRCLSCGTLVSQQGLTDIQLQVKNDDIDFYGKRYWLEHQKQDLGFPDIYARARNDLFERNLHWLKALLKYRLPPAKVLELGCSSGSFVALLRQAGYDASGVEMSPWIVEFGRKTFNVPILVGPVESLNIAPNSFDVIVLMDVLEHLSNPVETMAHCLQLLKPNGLLLIQTPQFKEGMDYTQLLETKGAFLEMLIPDEHLYLFSDRSVTRLFQQLGAEYIQFETAIFSRYDMFFVVSKEPLKVHGIEDIEPSLLATPNGRLVLALLDLQKHESDITHQVLNSIYASRAWRITAPLRWCSHQARLVRQQFRRFTKIKKSLKTIVVDLTPVLPGGDNGGAKIFVLELLQRLAEMAPKTKFVLFTKAVSHEELSILDRYNMRRVMVVGPIVKKSFWSHFVKSSFSFLLSYLPGRLKKIAIRLGYTLKDMLKHNSSRTLLRQMGADLLFCPFTAPTYFEPEIPTVCTIYDLQYKIYPEFFAIEEAEHRERVLKEACSRANMLTAISNYSRNSVITHSNFDPARIRTIYLRMAQRVSFRTGHDNGILSRLGLIQQSYLLYPANFWKHKNHEMLLTAFGIVCHEGLAKDVKLVCSGAPGERQDWLISAARCMELGDRVVFPGYLSNEEFAILMANCKGMVFPSLYEGFGLPVIEAMAAGVPVACSNITSLPEVAADAAIFFDPRVPTQIAQAMISLAEDNALCARLIEAGRKRAMEFSDTERMAREYLELFQFAFAKEKRIES